MAESDQFALHPLVSPGGILDCPAITIFVMATAVGGRLDWRHGVSFPLRETSARCQATMVAGARRRSLPSADAARAGTKRPATLGQQECSAPGQPVGAARCSPAVRPAARHPCSGLAAPAQQSDNARIGTRSTVASDDHPRPASTRGAQVKTLHRVSDPHRCWRSGEWCGPIL